jgi:hypothetical protein
MAFQPLIARKVAEICRMHHLVQLADMIAGCIAAYYKGSNKEFLSVMMKRIEAVEEYR